jgi:hypothetical protein
VSGFGIHEGQKTGAWIRFASRCQPGFHSAGQAGAAAETVAGSSSSPPQPATARTATTLAATAKTLTTQQA